MTETPLLNNEAARSSTGEILDQSTTRALEARQAELATQRLTDSTTTAAASSESTQTSDQTATHAPTETSTTTEDGKTLLTAKAPATPDAYTAFTAPEGYTLDPAAIEAFTPIAKELGLTQEQAQRLVSLNAEQMIAAAKAPADTYAATRSEWQSKAKADPDMSKYSLDGKTGLDAVKIDLGRALNSIGDAPLVAEFKAAMDLTGAGDNPAFIKTFWKLAQRITEGKAVSGGNPSPLGQRDPTKATKPTAAQSMYPNNPSAAG